MKREIGGDVRSFGMGASFGGKGRFPCGGKYIYVSTNFLGAIQSGQIRRGRKDEGCGRVIGPKWVITIELFRSFHRGVCVNRGVGGVPPLSPCR